MKAIACAAALGLGVIAGAAVRDDPPALGGPKVPEHDAQTLVRTDMQGKFVKVAARPEQAGLDLLGLDPERRERARGVVEAWTEGVRLHLVDNLDLVRAYFDANRAGDKNAARKVGEQLFDRFEPAKQRDPLLAKLGEVLTSEQSVRLKGYVDEYWEAWIASEVASNPKADRAKVQRRLSMQLFQAEALAAYEVVVRPVQKKIEAVVEAVEPTPEQREAIVAAAVEYIRENRLRADEAARKKLVRAVYDALDEERRVKLVERAFAGY
jgi:hypothetical protein